MTGKNLVLTLNQSACFELANSQNKEWLITNGIEWLITNGIGGYASSTVAGMSTRRYHGPAGRGNHPSGRQTRDALKT
jgi:Glycogen debranching enzyme N terminal